MRGPGFRARKWFQIPADPIPPKSAFPATLRLTADAASSGDCDIAFCFLDAEKEVYRDCYEAVIPRLVSGGLLVADNAINHAPTLQPMLDRALADERVDAMIVPIAKGELVCRKR